MRKSLFFNTEGPINSKRHYLVPPLSRVDLPGIMSLIEREKYFVLHAPRQTGKTTLLKALAAHLESTGQYRTYYINVEIGQSARNNDEKAFRSIVNETVERAEEAGEPRLREFAKPILEGNRSTVSGFGNLLKYWSELDTRPLVLFIDEVDALVGDTLISLLRRLRSGYDRRPTSFPSSVILCGVRDVRDYRIHGSSSEDKSIITGGSAFNIKAESLRLDDLDKQQIELLLGQHTEATGQTFTSEAIDAIWDLTLGQPWLVNALAFQACFVNEEGKNRAHPIDRELIELSKETLILRRDTHIDQLADKLRENRVRRVIQPILLGDQNAETFVQPDDLQYCLDLGLIRSTDRGPAIANPIYREIIPRELISDTQEFLKARFAPNWISNDGSLDVPKLMAQFQEFYCENGEIWSNRLAYREAGPQLLLQAFLQRVINGQGRIEREYALGTCRTDLFLRWPFTSGVQKTVIELKLLHKSLERTIAEGMAQVVAYAERCGADQIHLLVFTKKANVPMNERVFRRNETFQGYSITIWGM